MTHLDEFYYSFDKVKIDKLTGKPKLVENGNLHDGPKIVLSVNFS